MLDRGWMGKLAAHLKVQPSFVSQVMTGGKNFSLEQGLRICRYLGLKEAETDYYVCLLNKERAGSKELESYYDRHAKLLQKSVTEIKSRIPHQFQIENEAKSIFYSDWTYSAVRLLARIDGRDLIPKLSERIGVSPARIGVILEFLIENKLLMSQGGQIIPGPASTHIERESEYAKLHHRNWRQRVGSRLSDLNPRELVFTSPMTLSYDDFDWVRQQLLELIGRITVKVSTSRDEAFACLNCDLIFPCGELG